MNTKQLSDLVKNSPRRTPVRVYVWQREQVDFGRIKRLPCGENGQILFGEWEEIREILEKNREKVGDFLVEASCRCSALPLLALETLDARIEPGAILRAGVQVAAGAVVMMGAILNVGAQVGKNSMIDMGAVLGARATVGENCHVGANAVLAGVLEPASAQPVVLENGVLVGANAVILEGCRVGEKAVVAAGAVVTEDVQPGAVVAGAPARFIKFRDEKTNAKTALNQALR